MIIWNNGDGNDINQGGAGIDETLITQGNADDLTAITQRRAVTSSATTRPSRSTRATWRS